MLISICPKLLGGGLVFVFLQCFASHKLSRLLFHCDKNTLTKTTYEEEGLLGLTLPAGHSLCCWGGRQQARKTLHKSKRLVPTGEQEVTSKWSPYTASETHPSIEAPRFHNLPRVGVTKYPNKLWEDTHQASARP